MFFYKSILNLG